MVKNNPMHYHKPKAKWLERSFAEKDQSILVDIYLNIRQHCILTAKKVNSILGFISKSITRKPREVIIAVYAAQVIGIWGTVSNSGLPSTRGTNVLQ